MSKLVLPGEKNPKHRTFSILLCLGLTMIPALIIGIWCRPFSQEHIGLLLAAVCAGGMSYWTFSNLLTGVFKSRQGNYMRSEAPIRYWLNTGFIAAGTIMTVWFLIHQSLVVISAGS